MSELETRLESWRAVQAWLTWQQRQAAQAIASLEAELATVQARRPPPPPPEWKVESIRTASGPKALRVHQGDCTMAPGKPTGVEQVRRLLADGVEPCPYCNPDNALGIST
ncbi:DUF6233 domain-containing protein [Streptomyces sp. NBC_01565]|uniref:DUF6233 domain-containing protein n=1 Tax=Streptomyces sp. NBC_01565 TaxID=2975881 RepID=UPI0022556A9F|nr:DUF6233 domain-containing protein [Streptomyces sp. NBC_01565]MCX4547188.1 DUF6233 domain-containing protein [Streptomyces sp. NBC_01565]